MSTTSTPIETGQWRWTRSHRRVAGCGGCRRGTGIDWRQIIRIQNGDDVIPRIVVVVVVVGFRSSKQKIPIEFQFDDRFTGSCNGPLMILFTSRMNNDALIELSPTNTKLKKSSTLFDEIIRASIHLCTMQQWHRSTFVVATPIADQSIQQTVCRHSEKAPPPGPFSQSVGFYIYSLVRHMSHYFRF
jgi:hypothetical protein